MDLPLEPPIAPMLARLARTLPVGSGLSYEPKWDGFRCVAFRDGSELFLQSRRGNPLARYFPEIVDGLSALGETRFVLDGEMMVPRETGLDFAALLNRLHPARSRVAELSIATPAVFVAFDVLCIADDVLLDQPLTTRRRRLERVMESADAPLFLTPSTNDVARAAAWFEDFAVSGLDGVMAKDADGRYEPGRRGWVKAKKERTADCVVAGFRPHHDDSVGSLLLGVYGGEKLIHVGLASSFSKETRHRLRDDIAPFVTTLDNHPWSRSFGDAPPGPVARLPGTASAWGNGGVANWIPVRPERVAEIAYDHLDGHRFRHGVRFKRWRDDRDPLSCTFDQFERVAASDFFELVSDRR